MDEQNWGGLSSTGPKLARASKSDQEGSYRNVYSLQKELLGIRGCTDGWGENLMMDTMENN